VNVVFMGYGFLGARVLQGLAHSHEVGLVVTHETQFGGLNEPDVQVAAGRLATPVALSDTASEPDLHARIAAARPDVVVSTNWRTTVPAAVLRIPRLGAINVHDALLPKYAGFGAVNWAIRNGETATGLTVHFMDEELDTGPVITHAIVEIGPHDHAGHVLEKLIAQYVPVTLKALEMVEAGHLGEPQNGDGSFYHRVRLEDTRIDWRRDSTEIYNLVRAQSDPFVNAWTTHDGERLYVKAAALPTRGYRGTPGRVVAKVDGGIAVACGTPGRPDGRGIVLLQVQAEGGPPVRAIDSFLRPGDYVR
jgi:methionyl-tRNA formyltransferase